MNRKYRTLFACLLLMSQILSVSNVMAWPKDYLLELTIITDKQEEFVSIIELDDRQFRDLKNDTNFQIKPYLVQARKDYADEIGYRKEIYGKDNYKMVNITNYSFVVRDKSSGRVLLKK